MNTIHDILQRLLRHMSQSEISRRANIQQSKISRWANGEVPAGVSDSMKLLELDRQVTAELKTKPRSSVNLANTQRLKATKKSITKGKQ